MVAHVLGGRHRGRTVTNLSIGEYALLSDCRSAVLVSRDGSVDWFCVPRFDGPSIFARLLDEGSGHWSLGAVEASETRRHYLEGTMVLDTTFETPTGTAPLADAMAVRPTAPGHD